MRAYTRPVIISGLGKSDQSSTALQRINFGVRDGAKLYDEGWVQDLLDKHPALLPVDEIEPALTPLISICRELPLPSGFADNLYLTPEGGIVLVEAKLWRNPEARRQVIGQVLDYAKDLSRFSFDDFQNAARIARREKDAKLVDLVGAAAEVDEKVFTDAVSRNLRLGRFLLIIAGDGIQEGAEQLADFLQRDMSLHFTLALVELSLWQMPGAADVLVQPRVIARTVIIPRGVVRVEGASVEVVASDPKSPKTAPTTLSETEFFEALDASCPGVSGRLKAFVTSVADLGVYADHKKSLAFKWRAESGREFHLGVVDTGGRFLTDYTNWSADGIGRLDLSHAYMLALAAAIPSGAVKQTPKPTGWYVTSDGRFPTIAMLLDHADAWRTAIADYIQALDRGLRERPTEAN